MGAVGKAEGEGYFRSVAEALLGIMWTAEANGALDFANTRCYEYTGLNTEETIGSGWEQVLHPDDLAVPSQYDLEHAWPTYSYVVVSVRKGCGEDLRSWEMVANRSRFVEEEVLVRQASVCREKSKEAASMEGSD